MNFFELKKPYLIAEIGINHNADLVICKKLIDAAYSCDWNAVKFQKREPEVCVPKDQREQKKITPWGEMTYLEYKKRMELSKQQYIYLKEYCIDKQELHFGFSVFDFESLRFVLELGLGIKNPWIKIPSCMVTNLDLLSRISECGISVIISNGGTSMEQLDNAVNILLKKLSDEQVCILHCNASYPAPESEMNLNNIPMLAERYKLTIGLSDHSYGLETSVLGVVLGAKVIERHVTLDRRMWGTDQLASVEIPGMFKLKRRIDAVDVLLGEKEKKITEAEKIVMKKLRGE